MQPGTKSLLFGVHQFILHPLFLAVAWTKLYGFPFDPRLWVAFFVHDIGYWGMPNMDGEEGQQHPVLGGKIMARLFGKEWGDFTRFHSRHYARLENQLPSKLCAADKLVLIVTPVWLYMFLVKLSGEWQEYVERAVAEDFITDPDIQTWYWKLRAHWINEVKRLQPESSIKYKY